MRQTQEEGKEIIIINCPIPTDRRIEKLRGCLYDIIEAELLDESDAETVFRLLRECDRTYSEFCYHDVIRVLKEKNIEVNVTVITEEERKLLSEIFS